MKLRFIGEPHFLFDGGVLLYQPHPSMKPPEDENCLIWRYMNFAKFVSLLDSRTLFFTKVSNLRHGDPFEGTYPVANRDNIDVFLSPEHADFLKPKLLELMTLDLSGEWLFVNCWHISDIENVGMWSLYTVGSDLGIAIKSSFKRLCDCFYTTDGLDDNVSVYVGTVNYIDYDNELIGDLFNVFTPIMYKRKSYVHENELRAVYHIPHTLEHFVQNPNHNEPTKAKLREVVEQINKYGGVYLSIDLEVLIEKVVVSPNSPIWYFELVQSLMAKQDLDIPVVQSKLDDTPFRG